MTPPNDATLLAGETPFTAEERYRMRVIMKAFEGFTIEDMEEVRKIAQTGKVARTILIFLAKLTGWIGTALGVLLAYRSLWGKGSG